MKVLLAHLSAEFRHEASGVFERLGWAVLEAEGGLEAERLCRAERPDVAVVQAALGWGRPSSLVKHLKADTELRRIPLVVVGERLELDAALGGIEEGIDHALEPIAAEELAVRVKQAERVAALESRVHDHVAEARGFLHADSLTGLLDRRFLTRQLDAQINSARRHDQPLSILLIDLDNLKTINDTHGHGAGDDALRAVAAVLGDRLRDSDIAGRWGGDEFLVILPETSAEAAVTVARDLLAGVRQLEADPVPLTLSIGCAEWQEDDAPGLLQRADEALYATKEAGRDGVSLASAPRVEIPTPDTSAVVGGSGLRVLLVDDVESIRSLVRVTLEGLGMEVVGEAGDGTAGVEQALQARPDVVIMDWNMPGTDGIQATRELRRVRPETTVVAFTSTDDPRIHRALLDAGAAAHFNKREINGLMRYLAGLRLPAEL